MLFHRNTQVLFPRLDVKQMADVFRVVIVHIWIVHLMENIWKIEWIVVCIVNWWAFFSVWEFFVFFYSLYLLFVRKAVLLRIVRCVIILITPYWMYEMLVILIEYVKFEILATIFGNYLFRKRNIKVEGMVGCDCKFLILRSRTEFTLHHQKLFLKCARVIKLPTSENRWIFNIFIIVIFSVDESSVHTVLAARLFQGFSLTYVLKAPDVFIEWSEFWT